MRAGLLPVLFVAGCNALLGIDAATYEAPGADGGALGDGATSGGPSRDGAGGSSDPFRDGSLGTDASVAGRPEPGPCVDLPSNPRHCGACGHDCGPGACQAGVCQTGVVTTDADRPRVLLVAGDAIVYQTLNGLLRRVPIWGGTPETLFETQAADSDGLGQNMVTIGEHFYFADRLRKRVARCPLTGPCAPETVLGGFEEPYSLAIARGMLYVANGVSGTTILRCAPTPSCSREVFAQNEVGITRIAASDTDVVWSTITPIGTGSIRTRPVAAGVVQVLYTKPGAGIIGATSVLVAGRRAYSVFLGDLLAHSLDTPGAPERLGAVGPTETISLIGSDFWYGDFRSGDIHRRPLATPPTEPSATEIDFDGLLYDMVKRPNDIVWISGDRILRQVR